MRTLLLCGCLAVLSCTAIVGAPCFPGNLQTFIDLGATGCQVGAVQFTAFTELEGQTSATPVDPEQVQVTLSGTALNPTLLFTLNRAANAGQVFESFLRFSASGPLAGASLGLTSPAVTGDAAVTALLDVCANGSFSGPAPFGCPTSQASLVAFAIDQSSRLSDSARIDTSRFFDVLVDLTIDGGQSGSARLNSASVGFAAIPEPSAGLLVVCGLLAIAVGRARRRVFSWGVPGAMQTSRGDHGPGSSS